MISKLTEGMSRLQKWTIGLLYINCFAWLGLYDAGLVSESQMYVATEVPTVLVLASGFSAYAAEMRTRFGL